MKTGIKGDAYKRYGQERYIAMKKDGFDYCDFNMSNTNMPIYNCDNDEFMRMLKDEKELASDAGIVFSQVHGPWRYPPKDSTEEERAERLEKMKKSIRATRLLGCDYFVVHPIMPFGTRENLNPELLLSMNIDFFRQLMTTAREYGVTVCLENMPFKCLSLSTPAQILDFVKKFNDPFMKICFDTGHSMVFGVQPADGLRELGEYVKVLHVHDNNGAADEHRFPYTGVVDWQAFAKALKEVGYKGVLSVEAVPNSNLNHESYKAMNKALALIAKQIADMTE